MSDEETPDWLAQLDQFLSSVADFAKVIHGYHLALIEQGFTEAQALQLTTAFQTTVQMGGSQ